jgi:hypothetical protein
MYEDRSEVDVRTISFIFALVAGTSWWLYRRINSSPNAILDTFSMQENHQKQDNAYDPGMIITPKNNVDPGMKILPGQPIDPGMVVEPKPPSSLD